MSCLVNLSPSGQVSGLQALDSPRGHTGPHAEPRVSESTRQTDMPGGILPDQSDSGPETRQLTLAMLMGQQRCQGILRTGLELPGGFLPAFHRYCNSLFSLTYCPLDEESGPALHSTSSQPLAGESSNSVGW